MSTEIIVFLVFFLITIFLVMIAKVVDELSEGLNLAMFTAVACLEVMLWDTVILSYLHCEYLPLAIEIIFGYVISWIIVGLVILMYNFWQLKE